ncbi:GGDEF domain-containing protein [Dyella choica]|uniref:diguanylate cyclase n=2 Tax=Dyella choica TaxID=1927959 RepID=A0A432M774_9GAMM|nr:GGDEF domain-containing protein [Dyella choica]
MAVVCCALAQPGYATPPIANPAKFLDQAESLRLQDHSQFVRMLEQIQPEADALSESDQWHLRYLDAWEAIYEGGSAKSEPQLHQIIDRSGDPALIAKASSLLLKILSTNRRYEEAFALANHLASILPEIKDPSIRFTLLTYLSQTVDLADQTDLAVQYARMAEDAIPPGETACRPLMLQAAALNNGKRLKSASPELRKAIDVCTNARQPVVTNAMWLILIDLYLDENQSGKAMALLDQISPAIQTAHYYDHMLSFQVRRAQAYLQLGNDDEAKKSALSALAMSQPGDLSEQLMDAYQVLYQIEKKQGHTAAALAYYEHYAALDKSHVDDVRARALAYDMAEQQLLVQKMQADSLSKQNRILKLRDDLTSKAVETSRLYIALLLVVLVSVVFWLFRLKRSQLRFKQLSCLDGLTSISNHQHFLGEAERLLQSLVKRQGTACLIAIDLDHFKQINDAHGHALGDIVLKRTVVICRQHLRSTDLFGRLGGEEFCILLIDCQRERGMAIAERIRVVIEATLVDAEGASISFSASLGLACTDASGYDLQRLSKDADTALYSAKRTGRNRLVASGEQVDQAEAQQTGKRASML